jgi:hypothetical protein
VRTILRHVIARIRRHWPNVAIVVRGDSHMAGTKFHTLPSRERPLRGSHSRSVTFHYANTVRTPAAASESSAERLLATEQPPYIDCSASALPICSSWRGSVKPDPITQIQSFAMELLFRALDFNPINRTWEEYEEIMRQMPKGLKVLHGIVNDELARYSQTEEFKSRQFCRFKAGDTIVRYESFPTSISAETIRQALTNYGWREPRTRAA